MNIILAVIATIIIFIFLFLIELSIMLWSGESNVSHGIFVLVNILAAFKIFENSFMGSIFFSLALGLISLYGFLNFYNDRHPYLLFPPNPDETYQALMMIIGIIFLVTTLWILYEAATKLV